MEKITVTEFKHTFCIEDKGIGKSVEVYKAQKDDVLCPRKVALVNWSAIGSQTPEVTRRYAALLIKAAEIAEG